MTKAARRPPWHLQVRRATWVFWGYGPRGSVVHMDPAEIELGYGLEPLPFELPPRTANLPAPREYERHEGYGWRWDNGAGSGHDWKSARSVEDAVRQARRSLEHMRHDTRKIFERAVDDVRVND
ncbi:MAG TPA: hypothetical protein VLE97_11045 [Gaiellaceae bacterium]|nr:hypothetical protein [Gaiellaceae bacterium]